MKKYIIHIIVCLSAGCLFSCGDPINDYYIDKNKGASGGTIKEGLESNPNYSEFFSLLVETELVDLLDGSDDLLTIWAPVNGNLPAGLESMTMEEKVKLVQNHISTSIIYTRNFGRLSRIRTIGEKYLDVQAGSTLTIDGVELLDPDNVYDNEIIHGLEKWLVPRINIYEWLQNAPDEYSIFRDSLLSLNVKTFDEENSQIIGVDENGRVVYDTVWKTTNAVLDAGHIAIEDARYSFFIPSNDAIRQMEQEYEAYLASVDRPMGEDDPQMWLNWFMEASICNGTSDFAPGMSFRSVHGRELRADYQNVASRQVLSNGVVYLLDKCYVPRDLYFENTVFNPYYVRRDAMVNHGRSIVQVHPDGLDGFSDAQHQWSNLNDNLQTVHMQFTVSNGSYWAYSYNYDEEEEEFYPVNVMPGKYNVRARLRCFTANNNPGQGDSVYFYINDRQLAKVTGILSGQYDTEQGVIIARDVEINEKYEQVVVKVMVPDPIGVTVQGFHRRLGIGRVTLVPTDNY